MEGETQKETMPNRIITEEIKCDRNMPFCLYNNEENDIEKNKHFLVHKNNYEMNIIQNYFFDNLNKKEKKEENKEQKNEIKENIENNNNINIENDFINDDLNISANSLLIERQKHICNEEK